MAERPVEKAHLEVGVDNKAEPSPTPWSVHGTGSHLGIKDAKGKFVIRKVVNGLTIPEYDQLLGNFDHIVGCVNACGQSHRMGGGALGEVSTPERCRA